MKYKLPGWVEKLFELLDRDIEENIFPRTLKGG